MFSLIELMANLIVLIYYLLMDLVVLWASRALVTGYVMRFIYVERSVA